MGEIRRVRFVGNGIERTNITNEHYDPSAMAETSYWHTNCGHQWHHCWRVKGRVLSELLESNLDARHRRC